METLVAAAVLGPMVSVVTAYNAWAVYRACKDRYFPGAETPDTRCGSSEPAARRPN
jgi:hypothetical protein